MSTPTKDSTDFRSGLIGAGSFLIWGLVPVFWRQLREVSSLELIAHRIVWSLLLLLGITAAQKSFGPLRAAFTDRRTLFRSTVSSGLLAANWIIYVWAVNSGHIIESSLGYFLTPLGNVALGFLVLHERLRPMQWVAIGCATLGVGVLLLGVGHVPWIALGLAGTWSLYGICRKQSVLGSLAGLTVETIVLLPFAAGLLLWRAHTGEGALGHAGPWVEAGVFSTGVITALPLLMFAHGARRLRLATLGLLQYLAPTTQFILGRFVYDEPLEPVRLQAFAIIWCGLLLYTADSFWSQRRTFLKVAGVK